jgi:hypothetical protein
MADTDQVAVVEDKPASAPISDVKEIVESRPQLTPTEEAVFVKILPYAKALLRPEVRRELEVDYIKKQKEFEETLTEQAKAVWAKAIDDWKKDQAPLSQKDITQLLAQEYSEYTVPIKGRDRQLKEFTLVELPQASERKMFKILRDKLVPLIKRLVQAEFKLDLDTSTAEKLDSIIEAAPEVLDVLSELVIICLDPYNEDKTISIEWAKDTLSSYRLMTIVMAQVEVNKYRDFLLGGFRLSKSLQRGT